VRNFIRIILVVTALFSATPPFFEAICPILIWFQAQLQDPSENPPKLPQGVNATTIKTFSQGAIKVTLIDKDGGRMYIGEYIPTGEIINMIQTLSGDFKNAHHTYKIISETEAEVTIEITYPSRLKKSKKIITLVRQRQ
jgi:hypothetical protein